MATEKLLIRYDGLKQEIIAFKKGLNPRNTDYATGYFSALSVVEGMMVQHIAEETVEVVHGRWEPREDVKGFVRCSVCHDCNIYDEWPDGKKWNYCPNCGADMRGDGDG